MKKCRKCHKIKPFQEFSKNNRSPDKYHYWCKECCKEHVKKWHILDLKKRPWINSYTNAKQRCEDINCKDYRSYGAKGIKFLLTMEEVKKLWFESCTWRLNKPSIDRISSDDNYCYDNCRFIEKSINETRDKIKHKKQILQFDLQENFIKEWESITSAKSFYGNSIAQNLTGKYKQAYSFIWKYKNEIIERINKN